MDLVAFGFIALVLAVSGLLASVAMAVRHAVIVREERRYAARTARYARRPRITA